MHIFTHQDQFGAIQGTTGVIMTEQKGKGMNCMETYCIQTYQEKKLVNLRKNIVHLNPIY